MFRILESQAPAKQTATDAITTLSGRLQSATLLEDRRAAILGLRSFAKTYPASVASGSLRDLIASIRKDAEDVDTIKVVLETLLMLFSPDEKSPEASDEIVLWLADEFTQRQDNITALLDLLETRDFYSRLYSLQLISSISAARPDRTQECIFTAPLGISRLVNVLSDAREPVRNEALILLVALTPSSAELQKLVAFENAFDRTFELIEAEGSLSHGSEIVEDCLSLLANLLRLNASNQSYFRETGCVKKIAALLGEITAPKEDQEEMPPWSIARRDKNIWGLLAIIQLFLVRGGIQKTNQTAFWQAGIMEQVLLIAFSKDFGIHVIAMALETCGGLIRGNSALQEKFADIEVSWKTEPNKTDMGNGNIKAKTSVKINVIEALLKLALESAPTFALDARLAACECIKAFFAKHTGIRLHVLRRAIDGHMSGNDQIPNILSVLLEAPESRANADPYRNWIASVLMFHLVFEDPEAKALAMKVTEGNAEKGEEVVTCIQSIAGNLATGIQRGDDERISVAYLMLLCGWLFEDPDVVNDFLGEGSIIQSLVQEIKQSGVSNVLVPGLCSVLLGIIYEFSTKDSPIPRETLHSLLITRLGREQYIDKITKLREDPLVRDFEVLPRTSRGDHDGGLPEIFFDVTFIEFIKDNFHRLIRAIDREPGLEIPVITNGIQKGISRELVDSLRTQVEDRSQTIQKLEADLLNLQQKLEQEQLDHRRTRESTSHEISRIKQVNESLQRNHELEGLKIEEQNKQMLHNLRKDHELELSRLEEQHKQNRNDLLKQHGEQLRAIDSQLKETTADYEKKSTKLRQRHEDEVTELRKSIATLEADLDKTNKEHESELADLRTSIAFLQADLDKANNDHVQAQEVAQDEYSTKYSNLEARIKTAEQRAEKAEKDAGKAEKELQEIKSKSQKAQSDLIGAEKARKEAQSELEDLLIVFGDLEAKRKGDKNRLKELGEEVSEDEDEDHEEGEDEEDENDDVD
ncbi:putative intracellular protein transport protein [Talaromyces proteolyticus]|uniref:Intracellular protein transport protein n=1 Tax=Talaromyces proteolyticus TaxID=1131652 RepID=A0AAD4KSW2_9EURO|nr:putative intracellular protein transport protein [Talaromyces proteolyticus]KAH8698573.1 putative intracellular protein transport protein [Talaromyces proteolyticus]